MQPYGYDFYNIRPGRLLPVPKFDMDFENFVYQNWLTARRGWDGLQRVGAMGG